jgi:hypothetical protein
MALGTLANVWLHTDYGCVAGSAPICPVPLKHWELRDWLEGYLVAREFTAVLALDFPRLSEVIEGRVFRLYFRDGAVNDYDEVRIVSVSAARKDAIVTVEAVGPERDLADTTTLIGEEINGQFTTVITDYGKTPTQSLTDRVDAHTPSHWAVGTVTPTAAVDVAYSQDSPLSAALSIAAAAHAVTGVEYQISARRNGTTDYKIDLTVFGGSAAVCDIRSGRNLVAFQRNRARLEQTTRGYVEGGFRRAGYQISAISANTYIEVQGLYSSRGPARENDQFNHLANRYWIEDATGTAHEITDTTWIDYYTTRFAMASTVGMTVGDRGWLAWDSAGADLRYVDAPAAQLLYGIKIGVAPGGQAPYTNTLKNTDYRDWTGAQAVSWSKPVGVTRDPAKETGVGLWRTGGVSAKFTADGASDQGAEQSVVLHVPAADWRIVQWIQVMIPRGVAFGGGAAYVETYHASIGSGNVIVDLRTVPTANRGEWIVYTYDEPFAAAGAQTRGMRVYISNTSTGGTAYVDAAGAFVLPPGEAIPSAFVRGSTGAANIAAVNNHFDTNASPLATYQLTAADLYLIDPVLHSPDPFVLGGQWAITDAPFNETRTQLRVSELVRTSDNPWLPTVRVATPPRRFTQIQP